MRLYNATVSCAVYIWQMLWPEKLALAYPYPSGVLSLSVLLFAITILCVMTYVVWRFRRQRPYLLVGWFWYLIMLAPVIGLIQVGRQAHADRYTYLPHIGLYLAGNLGPARPRRFTPLSTSDNQQPGHCWPRLADLGRTQKQAAYWRDSESIWTRTLAVTSNNAIAHKSLGLVLLKRRKSSLQFFISTNRSKNRAGFYRGSHQSR